MTGNIAATVDNAQVKMYAWVNQFSDKHAILGRVFIVPIVLADGLMEQAKVISNLAQSALSMGVYLLKMPVSLLLTICDAVSRRLGEEPPAGNEPGVIGKDARALGANAAITVANQLQTVSLPFKTFGKVFQGIISPEDIKSVRDCKLVNNFQGIEGLSV